MRTFVIAVVILLAFTSSSFAESTIMWYWMTDTNERVTYTVTIDDETVDTERMNMFNRSLTTLSQNNQFSNLSQFENIVNRVATGEIRDFQIIDVTVNER